MNDLDQLYQQLILEEAKQRYGSGSLPGWEASSHQVNPTCGDEVTLQVKLSGTDLAELIWDGSGCSISQASLSIMSQMVEGKSLGEIEALTEDFRSLMHSRGGEVSEELLDRLGDASAFQGVSRYVNRVKCALLGWMALSDAIILAKGAGEESSGSARSENPHCCSIKEGGK